MEGPAAVNHGWRTSSYSNGGADTCIEVGAVPWRTSRYSNGGGSTCVEAGSVLGAILVRDTTDNGKGLTLRVTPAAWQDFTTRIRARS
jgi:hypothetical protein